MNFKKTLRVILYTLYFLIWAIALILAQLLFTYKYFNAGLMLGTLWGAFTLVMSITVLFILTGMFFLLKEKRDTIKKTILVCLIPFMPAVAIAGIYFFPKSLEKKEQTLELTYIAWACDCANWASPDDIRKYNDNRLEDHCIYIEPANENLELPDRLQNNNVVVRFTGKFYKRKGFPKGYRSIEQPEPARVFRYTKYEIVKPKQNAKKNRKKQ